MPQEVAIGAVRSKSNRRRDDLSLYVEQGIDVHGPARVVRIDDQLHTVFFDGEVRRQFTSTLILGKEMRIQKRGALAREPNCVSMKFRAQPLDAQFDGELGASRRRHVVAVLKTKRPALEPLAPREGALPQRTFDTVRRVTHREARIARVNLCGVTTERERLELSFRSGVAAHLQPLLAEASVQTLGGARRDERITICFNVETRVVCMARADERGFQTTKLFRRITWFGGRYFATDLGRLGR